MARAVEVSMLARTVVVLSLTLVPQLLLAQNASHVRALGGLRAVKVEIVVGGDASAVGAADSAGLRVRVEHQLGRSGIVVSDTASLSFYVFVNAGSVPSTSAYVYDVRAELSEVVRSVARPEVGQLYGSVWVYSVQGVCPRWDLAETVQYAAVRVLHRFENDYRAANPPQR
jgi:hypothetical protein